MNNKPFSVLISVSLILFLALTLIVTSINAGDIHLLEDVTPTVVPPDILTEVAPTPQPLQEDANPLLNPIIQSQQQSSPSVIDLQKMYPIFPEKPSFESVMETKLDGILMGNGMLRSIEPPVILHGEEVGRYELSDLAWEEWTFDSFITIWPGFLTSSSSQGILWVQIAPHHKQYQDRIILESPLQAGRLSVIGARRERLILNSEQGQIFYFDVPSLSFVDSLEEEVPIVTTSTSTATVIPPQLEDAPDLPIDALDYQPVNIPLDSFISKPDDYDWFHYYSDVPGTITVSLIPRTGNYGIRVVLVDDNQLGAIVEENTSSGTGRKEVTIVDAPSGDYLVRIWSLDGSNSEKQPYTLRFDTPAPDKVTPILECVIENTDGTYTARFGYENPNPFVVVADVKNHQNKFEPAPNFRIGQPEVFAPGRVVDWFSVSFDGNGLTWILDGRAVTANRNSPRCP
ncbi:MAG: hypothetical protein IT314_03065 [Anaerolineales bacterium]|nr:hypothetical protein [Anaerolineales bacterium]